MQTYMFRPISRHPQIHNLYLKHTDEGIYSSLNIKFSLDGFRMDFKFLHLKYSFLRQFCCPLDSAASGSRITPSPPKDTPLIPTDYLMSSTRFLNYSETKPCLVTFQGAHCSSQGLGACGGFQTEHHWQAVTRTLN
jgi:hypothetical protein